MLISVAWRSLVSRKKSALLTFLSLIISISVLVSVEHIRNEAKNSFNRTISGVDLIVGAPSGQLNLLLYSVFRMGSPTNNIQHASFEYLRNNKEVAWAIPISLGDSHRGFRVLGTNQDYFAYFRYGNKQSLAFQSGNQFDGHFQTVIGADVAKKLNYQVGDKIVIAHGIGSTSFTNHDNAPFTISGVLAPTGTPVDKTVHVSLQAIEAIHLPPHQVAALVEKPDLLDSTEIKQVTAVLLGLSTKFATFKLQRSLNNYQGDRLMAILPGVAMSELWQMMGNVENLLRVISLLVLLSSLFGLATMLLASMNERRAEIAVLRVLGAGPVVIFTMILVEALILSILAMLIALGLVSFALFFMQGYLAAEYGLFLTHNVLSTDTLITASVVIIATIITALLPAVEAYRSALHAKLAGK